MVWYPWFWLSWSLITQWSCILWICLTSWNLIRCSSCSEHPFYDLDDGDGSITEPSIDIIQDPVTQPTHTEVDPTSRYLYALNLQLQTMQSDQSCFYQIPSLTIESIQLLAHMDAGSMVSTTNCHQFLWGFQSLHGSAATLWVTDNTPHHPTGIGYLKVPIVEPPGYGDVRTFYTPSLLATIISPTSIVSDLCCLGYSIFANLDGQNCYFTLHSSNAIKITFPLQLLHGLLFTQPL